VTVVDHIRKAFPHTPNGQQLELFDRLHAFLQSRDGDECFILRGYAGTGKTTVVGRIG
jgi:alpha-D-ribose 1-methylphosphonate 5-triphosphate synthase subunit PhnL